MKTNIKRKESLIIGTIISFILMLLNNKIDSPDLLEQIYLQVPVYNIRQTQLLFTWEK